MGIPAFYRWLSERYPKIVVYAKEESNPCDLTEANPNGYEFDNLYLDMNCLIHPCTHPEEGAAPGTEEEMFVAVFKYVDRLFSLIRPRKVLYMAIDGVAPRAKMNQQRSRRFRSSQEADEAVQDAEKLRKEIIASGRIPPKKESPPWDSNVITPGTPFMTNLAKRFREYVAARQNLTPGWKEVKVVFSDAQSPGEGEHKIMDFVRSQRAQKDYDPNTTHCLYGLDADLIMLGLATHELHFSILREEVLFGRDKKKQSFAVDQVLLKKDGQGTMSEMAIEQYELLKAKKKPFQLLRLWVLREYLGYEFSSSQFYTPLPFPLDLERCIDDFIFLCFFVGNDFLPHLPTLSIREGGLELLIDLYKRFLPTLDGYLTDNGVINLSRVEVMLKALGAVEDEIFRRRRAFEKNLQRRRKQQKESGQYNHRREPLLVTKSGKEIHEASALMSEYNEKKTSNEDVDLKADENRKVFKAQLKAIQKERTQFEVVDNEKDINKDSKVVIDDVRLGEEGWKQRYYDRKFSSNEAEMVNKVAEEYVLGLCWVLLYYYKGCQSWRWFYPFHYAPFASDLVNIGKLQEKIYDKGTTFGKSKPFSPYEQLLGVLPASSAHALPEQFHWYMTNEDSPIIDFYPTDFQYDPNGKGVRWLWVALLPFVDEKRVMKVMAEVNPKLSDEQRNRNLQGDNCVFINSSTETGKYIKQKIVDKEESQSMSSSTNSTTSCSEDWKGRKIKAKKLNGLSGYFGSSCSPQLNQPFHSKNPFIPNIKKNESLCLAYKLPKIKSSFAFIAKMFPTVQFPASSLTDSDIHAVLNKNQRRGHFVGNIYGEMFDPKSVQRNDSNSRQQSYQNQGGRHQQRGSNGRNWNSDSRDSRNGGNYQPNSYNRGHQPRSYGNSSYGGYNQHNSHVRNPGGSFGRASATLNGSQRNSGSNQGSWGSHEPRNVQKRTQSYGRHSGHSSSHQHYEGNRRSYHQNNTTQGGSQYQSKMNSQGNSYRNPVQEQGQSNSGKRRSDPQSQLDVLAHIEAKMKKRKM